MHVCEMLGDGKERESERIQCKMGVRTRGGDYFMARAISA